MTITAKIIADSINEDGHRITTMELKYWRAIHAEYLTHRIFSRNASSSRAIPVKKMLSNVWNEPAMPVHWGKNQAGMQAREELSGWRKAFSKAVWRLAGKGMCGVVWTLSKVGLHKQVANRLLEPWQHIHVVCTSTEWENFFALRCHPDAQPEIQELAMAMRSAMEWSTPRLLRYGEWHLPYVNCLERKDLTKEEAIKVSAARCCRVSYLNHGGVTSTLNEDEALFNKLTNSEPPHASPLEHAATPTPVGSVGNLQGNLVGWNQFRKIYESEKV
jgi:hypothetical protein